MLIGPPGNDGVGSPGRQGERGEPGRPGKEKKVANTFLRSGSGIFSFVHRQAFLGQGAHLGPKGHQDFASPAITRAPITCSTRGATRRAPKDTFAGTANEIPVYE